MKISANDFRRQWLETCRDTLEAVERVGAGGWYILGPEVQKFEEELSKLWGIRISIGVASGLDAVEISLRALGCGPGHRVLTTPVSAFATTLAIVKLGATPVFCDVDRHGLIDLDCCEAALRQNPDIRFFVPVHLYGHSLDMERLESISGEFQVSVVEDCAQSILAKHRGRPTGTAGQLAATSFYPTKNLGALGDGGAILTTHDGLSTQVRALRDYGQSGKYQHERIGYNSRLDELQAAILSGAHLPRLQKWTARRKEIADTYTRGILHRGIEVVDAPNGSDSCWHLYPVFVSPDRRGDFIRYMQSLGIAVGEHYPTPVCDQVAMQSVRQEIVGSVSKARRFCSSEVSLPIHPYLADAEVEAVINSCNRWGG